MKKTMLVLLVLLMCGCSSKDKYKDFEHYDLSEFYYKEYIFPRENEGIWNETEIEKYAIASLDPKGSEVEGHTDGLLYRVSENDYILLDSFIGLGDSSSLLAGSGVLQYEDKIYVVRGLMVKEFTLDREKTKVRELSEKFDYNSIVNKYAPGNITAHLYGHKIEKVDDDYIYFGGISIFHTDENNIEIKCSLNDYKCEEI